MYHYRVYYKNNPNRHKNNVRWFLIMNSVMSIIESRILATNGGASAENITIRFELLHNSEEQRHFFPSLAFAKHTSKGSPEKDMEFFFL